MITVTAAHPGLIAFAHPALPGSTIASSEFTPGSRVHDWTTGAGDTYGRLYIDGRTHIVDLSDCQTLAQVVRLLAIEAQQIIQEMEF